jgi:transposase-like protein
VSLVSSEKQKIYTAEFKASAMTRMAESNQSVMKTAEELGDNTNFGNINTVAQKR